MFLAAYVDKIIVIILAADLAVALVMRRVITFLPSFHRNHDNFVRLTYLLARSRVYFCIPRALPE